MCCGPAQTGGFRRRRHRHDFTFCDDAILELEVVSSDVTTAQEVGEYCEESVEELCVGWAADDGASSAAREADASAEIIELCPEGVVRLVGRDRVLWPRLVVDGIVRAHSGHPAQVVGQHVC